MFSTTLKLSFCFILLGRGSCSLNNTSYFLVLLFNKTLTPVTILLSPKFNPNSLKNTELWISLIKLFTVDSKPSFPNPEVDLISVLLGDISVILKSFKNWPLTASVPIIIFLLWTLSWILYLPLLKP